MGRLIYTGIMSLDGYVADQQGDFDWSAPDEEVHAFVNDLERETGTYLYGRRMYEVMAVWESLDLSDEPPVMRDFAGIWRSADKVVYSRTLSAASTNRTRVEHSFDAGAIEAMKAATARDIGVGGAELAAQVVAAGLVDEFRLFISPIIVGGGTPFLPDRVRFELELLEERRFGNGVVFLRYRNAGS
jgi:dihydrofolate reductase